MVPCEKIIETALAENVDVIGLSGLITPSLDEMIHVAKELERNNIKIPLLIGGATTSKIHTALRIAPEYSAPVVYVKDASQSVNVVNSLLSEGLKEGFLSALKADYKKAIGNYEKISSGAKYLTLDEARKNKFNFNWKEYEIKGPAFLGNKVLENFPLKQLIPYIDWTFFFHQWDIPGRYPKIFDDPVKGDEAKKLYDDAQKMLERIVQKNMLKANAVFGFYPANSDADDICLYDTQGKTEWSRFCLLRNQRIKTDNTANLCLSDFIMPKEENRKDYIGLFAVTAGLGAEKWVKEFKDAGNDYDVIMLKILADRLAEAFAELLHEKVRREYWGYAANEKLSNDDILHERYRGIRPALGYPSLPDHTLKKTLFEVLDAEKNAGIELTESFMMVPQAAVCGLYIAHPESKYFDVQKISQGQVQDYAVRCNISIEEAEKRLSQNLNYK